MKLNKESITSIYDNYLIIKDSIKVTQRVISKKIPKLYNKNIFENENPLLVIEKIKTSEKEFSDLIVLALFASFERQLRDEIIFKSSILQTVIPDKLGENIDKMARVEIEKWRIGEIIDLFKFAVKEPVLGRMKQILNYRNWVAHGKNPSIKKIPPLTEPKITYETIILFIDQIQTFYDRHA